MKTFFSAIVLLSASSGLALASINPAERTGPVEYETPDQTTAVTLLEQDLLPLVPGAATPSGQRVER